MWQHLRHWLLPHESNNHRARLLHPGSIAAVIGLFVLLQISLSSLAGRFPQILGYAAQIVPTDIVRLTNVERAKLGLGNVQLDTQLSIAAAQKAADMFARNYWAHVSPVGTQPWGFITEAGYTYRYAGENLARDFANPEMVVKAWMESPTHRENLLNSRYQDIGVAVVDGKLGDHETTLVVQMFGTKVNAQANRKPALAGLAVKAAETSAVPTVKPITSPFTITRLVSVSLIILFLVILVIDIYHVHQKKIARWTSKSLAHLIFLAMLLIAALLVARGQIL